MLFLSSYTPAANAHGALIEVTQKSVEVSATFEDGKPMANAQVMVYAPDDLQTPWKQGETDEQGRYQFVPTAEKPGDWEVIVSQAGHGGIAYFEVNESGDTISQGARPTSPAQKWGTIAAVVWGFVGTALFFSSRGTQANAADTLNTEQASVVSSTNSADMDSANIEAQIKAPTPVATANSTSSQTSNQFPDRLGDTSVGGQP